MKVAVLFLFIFFSIFSAYSDDSFFGVNGVTYFHLKDKPNVWSECQNRLELSKNLGITNQRVDFWWGIIEPKQGEYQWEFADKVFNEYAKLGQTVMPIFCYSSAWSNNVAPDNDDERRRFGEFVFQSVKRYKDKVKYWEIWNEPNILPYWYPRPDAELYTELLKVAYVKAKEASIDCIIIGACTAGADYDFIENIYTLGGGKFFDVLSYHHYETDKNEETILKEILSIHKIMTRYGDSNKKIWITEMGLPTGYDSGGRIPYSIDEQASWMIKKYLTAIGTGLVEKIFWFSLIDEAKTDKEDGNWGLYYWDKSLKPSGKALKNFVLKTSKSEYIGNFRLYSTIVAHVYRDLNNKLFAILWDSGKNNQQFLASADNKTDVSDKDIQQFPSFIFQGKLHSENLFGEEIVVKDSKNKTYPPITSVPFYVSEVSEDIIPYATLTLNPKSLYLYPNQESDIEIGFKNNFKKNIAGNLVLEFDKSLNINNLKIPIQVEKGQDFICKTKIKAPNINKYGWYCCSVKIVFDELKMSDFNNNLSKEFWVCISKPINIEVMLKEEKDNPNLIAKIKNLTTMEINGELRWGLNTKSRMITKPSNFTDLKPNQVWEDICAIREGTNEAEILAEVQTDNEVITTESLRLCIQNILSVAPIIDGKIGEWYPIDFVMLNGRHVKRWEEDKEYSESQSSAKIWVGWDSSNVYIAALVNDRTPMVNPFRDGEIWRGDCLEVYFGFEGHSLNRRYKNSQYHIGLSPGTAKIPASVYNWNKLQKIENAEIKVTQTNFGWTLEARIPLDNFNNFIPSAQKVIGFDISLNNLSNIKGEHAETQLIWNGNDQNYTNPSKWGAAILIASRKKP